MCAIRVLTDKLRFPEGPVPLPDGSVLVVEIQGQALTRVYPDGRVEVVAELGGGPNGAALGPDGRAYVCNNGGFHWPDPKGGALLPHGPAHDYQGGSIQAVDLSSGKVETLYTHCGEVGLKGPNDLVFDETGGFWFTDHGGHHGRSEYLGTIYYARPDGSAISEVLFPFRHANGIALSPDDRSLYIADSFACRLCRYDIVSPGVLADDGPRLSGRSTHYQSPTYRVFDSIAVEASGNICIGVVAAQGGIATVSPRGELVDFLPLPDPVVTNIAFGGPDMDKAYVTLSSTGQLLEIDWPRPGHPPHFAG
ncbi:SMP-30/gluconolactonase/LRE family protein [Niveispirillum fermenti]|uniref:SMP-30/gluconolactonase/LRE family protein n=1 Tax=Niveispirillum fermenti TaxID=1233113 RepID=UPI003A8C0A1B